MAFENFIETALIDGIPQIEPGEDALYLLGRFDATVFNTSADLVIENSKNTPEFTQGMDVENFRVDLVRDTERMIREVEDFELEAYKVQDPMVREEIRSKIFELQALKDKLITQKVLFQNVTMNSENAKSLASGLVETQAEIGALVQEMKTLVSRPV